MASVQTQFLRPNRLCNGPDIVPPPNPPSAKRRSTNQSSPSLKLPGVHSQESSAVYISQAEYDGLVKVTRQYARLRHSLLQGGINEETIAILSSDDASMEESHAPGASQGCNTARDDGISGQYEDDSKSMSSNNPQHTHRGHPHPTSQHRQGDDWAKCDPLSENVSVSIDSSIGGVPVGSSTIVTSTPPSPQLDRIATRTIHLSNLADGVTHADITEAVRGGQLLEVYLRLRDRTATVSFVYGEDAKAFYARARQSDLYFRNKRVDLRWGDRQFILSGHVAHKLRMGASRNLVIRKCDPNHTEETIRDDLEHIHNLVVISVSFVRGDCFINTNSIHNAIFARTCMMSRAKYRGSQIQWAADECAQPLAELPVPRRSSAPPMKTQSKIHSDHTPNRFRLLDLGDEEDFTDDNIDSDDSNDTLH